MASRKFADAVTETVERINAELGEDAAGVRDERARPDAHIEVGFAGMLEADRSVTPATRERATIILSLRTGTRARSGAGTIAVLVRHEAALCALIGWVPSVAEDLIFGQTRQANIELGNTETITVETEILLRIELESR